MPLDATRPIGGPAAQVSSAKHDPILNPTDQSIYQRAIRFFRKISPLLFGAATLTVAAIVYPISVIAAIIIVASGILGANFLRTSIQTTDAADRAHAVMGEIPTIKEEAFAFARKEVAQFKKDLIAHIDAILHDPKEGLLAQVDKRLQNPKNYKAVFDKIDKTLKDPKTGFYAWADQKYDKIAVALNKSRLRWLGIQLPTSTTTES